MAHRRDTGDAAPHARHGERTHARGHGTHASHAPHAPRGHAGHRAHDPHAGRPAPGPSHAHGTSHGTPRRHARQPLDLAADVVAALLRPFVALGRAVRRTPLLGAALIAVVALAVAVALLVRGCAGAAAPQAQPQDDAGEAVVEDAEPEPVVTDVTAEGVSFTGPESFPSSEAYAGLAAAISDFEAQGFRLGFVLVDVTTGNALSYNADEYFYSASTLKGPYVLSMYQNAEETGSYLGASDTVRDCIVDSDNNAYETLRMTFHTDHYVRWLTEAGLSDEQVQRIYDEWFCDVTPNELAAMWHHGYDYLAAGSADAMQLRGFFAESGHSCIHAVCDGTYEAWCKPGWYPAGDSAATNDAGVVRSDTGDYVLVVMSDAPSDFAAVVPVVDALNAAHGQLTGGATDSLVDADTVIPVDE